MAKSILGGNASARKSSRTAFDSPVTPGTAPTSAEAKSPALSPELTAAILRLVKEATHSAMRDVIGAPTGSVMPSPTAAADEPTHAAPAAPTNTPAVDPDCRAASSYCAVPPLH